MTLPNESRPKFSNAPTVETVLGVQFETLRQFRCGHYGAFWKEHLVGRDYTLISDEPLLPTFVEKFDDVKLKLSSGSIFEDVPGVRHESSQKRSPSHSTNAARQALF